MEGRDKLRGSMDASQYKDVILGLIFLKYVSDAFDERRDQIRAELRADGLDDEQIERLLDDVDEYTGQRRVLGPSPTPAGSSSPSTPRHRATQSSR